MYELTRIHDIKSNPVEVGCRFSSPRLSSPHSSGSAESFSSLKVLPTSGSNHAVAMAPPFGDYLALLGRYGRRRSEFSNPQGVCVDSNDRIYCTDSTNQTIQIFTENGSHISSIERRGRQLGQFLRPIGICFTKDGCLLFTDYENKCVNVFSNGEFIRRIGTGKLIGPKGVTVSHRGTVLVADNKGNQVLEFSVKGRLIRKISANKSDKAAQLTGPHYVAVNKHGEIHVTDFHNHSVKVYSREGNFMRSFGQHGSGNGQFHAPTGISIDSEGFILVADWGNSRIQVFEEDGSFLSLVDTSSAPLFGPQAVYAMRDNKVAVADSGNHCVKIFHYDVC